uniref:SFRICE_029163 n=1 Tax=Spodoptera frugiperda TaxID=7108 RepID=A0A2H1W4U7_SPOFR
MAEWQQRLSQPRAGLAVIAAVSPLIEEWLEKRHGVLIYRLTQVLTGHGSFSRFLFLIGREETPGCHHCEDRPEDTVEHTVVECPAWAEHRCVLRDVVDDGDLSRPALVQAMVRSEGEWDAVSHFCEAVMLAKEEAGRVREQTSSRPSRRDTPGVGDREMISGHQQFKVSGGAEGRRCGGAEGRGSAVRCKLWILGYVRRTLEPRQTSTTS